MLRVMTGSWHIPEIYTPRQRPFHPLTANPSPMSRRPVPAHLQSISNQSPTSRHPVATSHRLVADFCGQFSPTSRQPVPNWSVIDRRLLAIDLQLKNGGIGRTALYLFQWVFGRKAVADSLQCMCDRGSTNTQPSISSPNNIIAVRTLGRVWQKYHCVKNFATLFFNLT